MARVRPHLDRTPIVEAVIDLRLEPSADSSVESIGTLIHSIEGYEHQGPIVHMETKLSIEEAEAKSSTESRRLGARLQSSDGKHVLLLQEAGYTLSRLSPYVSWDQLVAEARKQWRHFADTVKPQSITRVATRFINRLELPMQPGEDFSEYLVKPPEVPDELPQAVAGFSQRVVLVNRELNARANVIQSLQEGFPSSDKVPVVVDIDVYSMVDMSPDNEDAWDLLAGLREFKNAVFYAHLTEKTVALYE